MSIANKPKFKHGLNLIDSRISYLNGQFLPHEKCLVHIEDRGFQFADGVYEVTPFKNNKLIDGDAHIERLFRSLREINIDHNFSKKDLIEMQFELFRQNKMTEGNCYLQITRGATNRIQTCPKGLTPTICATVTLGKKLSEDEFSKGIKVMTHEDIRWQRCDIKSLALLASTLINQKAKDSGFDDAIFVRDEIVTEATFANVFIIDEQDNIITKTADNFILQGITRNRFIKIALEKGFKVIEKNFSAEEMIQAKEVFLTSSGLILRPVTKINNQIIGDGKVGKITKFLNEEYKKFIA
ncbi:MAG: aminotransferase class IV [Rickettsiales bacterium]|nr:aminotransferase class IV [Rickettsiales bacterium]